MIPIMIIIVYIFLNLSQNILFLNICGFLKYVYRSRELYLDEDPILFFSLSDPHIEEKFNIVKKSIHKHR